jgi:hypothetical protein
VIEAGGVTLVVMERSVPPFHAEQLLSVGIDAREAEFIVAKGAVAWRSACGDVAGTVIEVDSPGICPLDPARARAHDDPDARMTAATDERLAALRPQLPPAPAGANFRYRDDGEGGVQPKPLGWIVAGAGTGDG